MFNKIVTIFFIVVLTSISAFAGEGEGLDWHKISEVPQGTTTCTITDKWGDLKGLAVYNSSGKIVETTEYVSYYDFDYITMYEYNSSGNLIQVLVNEGETPSTKLTYTYSGNRMIESAFYAYESGAYELWNTTDYEYDSKGNIIKEIYNFPSGSRYELLMIYNSSNMMIKDEYYNGEQLSEIATYEYDSHGNVTKFHTINYEYDYETEIITEYDYDSSGRIVEERQYMDGDMSEPYYQFFIEYN